MVLINFYKIFLMRNSMNRKILIVSVIALIAIITVGSASAGFFDFLTGDSERAPDELVCAAMPHGEEPEYGFDPMHGWGYHDSGTDHAGNPQRRRTADGYGYAPCPRAWRRGSDSP